jgi:hypothetical protein
VDIYVGMPWATWIDKLQKLQWSERGQVTMQQQLRLLAVRLSGYRHALAALGLRLRVHTVCQHIGWRRLLDAWRLIGVTDLWISHCEPSVPKDGDDGPCLHPWRLFAVNVEDPTRRAGLEIGRDPATKPLLASFVGSDAPHYLTDVRRRLVELEHEPDIVVRMRREWHFERIVYGAQLTGSAGTQFVKQESAEVYEYNRLISESRYVLCPAGAGPNTLRLWEALAVGSVPVVLGKWPAMPSGGGLAPINWQDIVLCDVGEDLQGLVARLRSIPLRVLKCRSAKAMDAFAAVRLQTCFVSKVV